jgi:chaperonin GroEL
LLKAVQQPAFTIAANAGYDPHAILARLEQAGPGYGLDATTGQIVPMVEAGIFDVATVLKSAAFSAISSAALALTVDVMVQHRNPTQAALVAPTTPRRL